MLEPVEDLALHFEPCPIDVSGESADPVGNSVEDADFGLSSGRNRRGPLLDVDSAMRSGEQPRSEALIKRLASRDAAQPCIEEVGSEAIVIQHAPLAEG